MKAVVFIFPLASFKKIKNYFIIFICHCITCIQGPWRPECPIPLGLELQTSADHHMGAGNGAQVFPESTQCSVLLPVLLPVPRPVSSFAVSTQACGPPASTFTAPLGLFPVHLHCSLGSTKDNVLPGFPVIVCACLHGADINDASFPHLIIQRITVWTVYYIVIVVQGN